MRKWCGINELSVVARLRFRAHLKFVVFSNIWNVDERPYLWSEAPSQGSAQSTAPHRLHTQCFTNRLSWKDINKYQRRYSNFSQLGCLSPLFARFVALWRTNIEIDRRKATGLRRYLGSAKKFLSTSKHPRFNKAWRQKWKSPLELIKETKQVFSTVMWHWSKRPFPGKEKEKNYNIWCVSPFWFGASFPWQWSNTLVSVLSISIHVFLPD